MERTISISTEVFAKIWSLREEGEETEDAVLQRVLSAMRRRKTSGGVRQLASNSHHRPARPSERVTWRDDVRSALESLRGTASLFDIYKEVKEIRKAGGRSIPVSFEPVIRRTLEENSSESEVYRGGPDLFYMPEGKGMGVWGLR